MPWWTKTFAAHGTLRKELGPLKVKGAHRQRIFLGASRLVAYHIQDWEKNHEAGNIHMQESTGDILQQRNLYWCQYITSMLSQTYDTSTNSQHHKIDPLANKHNFNYPKTPPYPPASENIQKLKNIAVGPICHHSV